MDDSSWKEIQGIDKHCFACGIENKHGLQMKFESNGEKLRSHIIVPEHLRGWHNLVHGGIISTIIDETMSWAAIQLHKRFILTKNMNVNFRKPVIINTSLVSYGYVKEKKGDRHVIMAAEIRGDDGVVLAEGTGEFVLYTVEEFADMNIIDKPLLEEMAAAVG